MNFRIGKISVLVLLITLATNVNSFEHLNNLFYTSTELVNQSREFVALAQSSVQDKTKFEWLKENKRVIGEVVLFVYLMCRSYMPIVFNYPQCPSKPGL